MSKRILVIDDDEETRMSSVMVLKDTGFEVDTAEAGEEGLQMKIDAEYNLIFLDLKMSGMNNVETLRQIRRTDRKIPIYIVTAFQKEFLDELKIAQKEMLSFEILLKPIDAYFIVRLTKLILGQPDEAEEAGNELRLYLFTSGETTNSVASARGVVSFLKEELRSRYSLELEVINVLDHPLQAKNNNVLATPTLIKTWPPPEIRIVGDLSDKKRVAATLRLITDKKDQETPQFLESSR